MGRTTKVNALLVAAAAAAALAAAAAPAVAGGTGNTVNNCYGIWWNTDWDQRCGSGGASATGWYRSTADCASSGDHTLDVYRNAGSTTSYDGQDCTFSVRSVATWYQ